MNEETNKIWLWLFLAVAALVLFNWALDNGGLLPTCCGRCWGSLPRF